MIKPNERTVKVIKQTKPGGGLLFLAYIGAAIYFVGQTSGGFWEVILGLLKALVWPVFVIYEVLKNLGV